MATGDLTVTKVGIYDYSSAVPTGLNCGGATAGAEISTFYFIPLGNGQYAVLKAARAA